MEDNPYVKMAEGMKNAGRTRQLLRMGIVTSTAPLVIQSGGIPLSGNDLYVNRMLLGYGEKVSLQDVNGTLNATCDCEQGSIQKLTVAGGVLSAGINHPLSLAVGDTVALLSEDDQTYVVLCKVVRMG